MKQRWDVTRTGISNPPFWFNIVYAKVQSYWCCSMSERAAGATNKVHETRASAGFYCPGQTSKSSGPVSSLGRKGTFSACFVKWLDYDVGDWSQERVKPGWKRRSKRFRIWPGR